MPNLSPHRVIRLNIKISGYTGMAVIWDTEQLVQVIAPSSLKNQLCGLCGTFNDRSQDDFLPANSLTWEEDSQPFALTWKVCLSLPSGYRRNYTTA